MLCALCGGPTDTVPCAACGRAPHLEGRYALLEEVGHGSFGTTFRARRVADGAVVAVKALPYRAIADLKMQEMFEREARVLAQLDHPAIPRGLESFVSGEGLRRTVYLVETFMEGRTLAAWLEQHRPTEAEVLVVLEKLLDVLAYLHGRSPPVIHRDLKPANVILRDEATLELAVVDFGAVRDTLRDPALGGSTIAGTFGYMAPEQLRGQATPATDIYACGALAVRLLSGQEPDVLTDHLHRLRWESAVQASPGVMTLLRRMLAPDPLLRRSSAEVLAQEVRRTRAGLAARVLLAPLSPAPPARTSRLPWATGAVALAVALAAGAVALARIGATPAPSTSGSLVRPALTYATPDEPTTSGEPAAERDRRLREAFTAQLSAVLPGCRAQTSGHFGVRYLLEPSTSGARAVARARHWFTPGTLLGVPPCLFTALQQLELPSGPDAPDLLWLGEVTLHSAHLGDAELTVDDARLLPIPIATEVLRPASGTAAGDYAHVQRVVTSAGKACLAGWVAYSRASGVAVDLEVLLETTGAARATRVVAKVPEAGFEATVIEPCLSRVFDTLRFPTPDRPSWVALRVVSGR